MQTLIKKYLLALTLVVMSGSMQGAILYGPVQQQADEDDHNQQIERVEIRRRNQEMDDAHFRRERRVIYLLGTIAIFLMYQLNQKILSLPK